MKILYLCTYYHRAMVFRDSMDYLEARGHQVKAFNAVVEGAKIDDKYKAIMDEKVVHSECFRPLDRYFFFRKQHKIMQSLEKNITVTDFDLIHSHTLLNGGWSAYRLHRKYGIPFVVSVRNTDMNVFLKIPFFKMLDSRIIRAASGVLFFSEAYRKQFLRECCREKDREMVLTKSDVIQNGLEPFWLENIGQARQSVHQPLELLCVGKIDRNKNIETTVKVVDRLNKKGTASHLTVIGQVLDEKVKNLLDNSENVSAISYLKKEELIQYYREADIFIMPSFKETFGRVYAEAMTQGVPVIYSRGQGFDGTFPGGTVGFDVRADNIDEITEAVERIIRDYARISANCVQLCKIFNWNDISERLEKLYERALYKNE